MTALLVTIRDASRTLVRAPRFSLFAIAVLALGIGASTAMFTAVNAVLLNPVPYPQAGRIVMLWDHAQDGERLAVTFGTYSEIQARSRSFDSIAVLAPWQPTLTGIDEPELLTGQRVSASYFRVLGVAPALGAGFDREQDRPDGARTAIISDRLWHRRFSADPAMLGRQVELDSESFTVVGVMPAQFDDLLARSADVWTLLQYDAALPAQGREWGRHLQMIARLRPGLSTADAATELAEISSRPVAEFVRPAHVPLEHGVAIVRLQDELTSAIRPGFLAALAGVLVLLLITCVNVANLLLVRGAQREGELEMRAALGADSGRLLRQLLTENFLLAGVAGAFGLFLAYLSLNVLVVLAPPNVPSVNSIGIDHTAIAGAVVITGVIGLLTGLVPALRASRIGWRSRIQPAGSRVIGRYHAARQVLVAAQVALAVVLLISAGLLVRSLERLYAVDVGFASSGLLTLRLHASGESFEDMDAIRRYYDQIMTAVRELPGVESAAFTSQLPLSGDLDEYGARFEPLPGEDAPATGVGTLRYAVSADYFMTMGMPLLAGRGLEAGDNAVAPLAAVISESLARLLDDGDPIGRRLRIGAEDSPWYTVVGVVGDVRQAPLATGPANAVYVNHWQWRFADPSMSFVIRSRDPTALIPTIRTAIRSMDENRPISRIATMDELLAASAAERRFASLIFSAYGLAALLLAAVGVYGVVAVNVADRGKEIGLRIALGAQVSGIVRWLLGRAAIAVIAGILIGLVIALGTTQLLQSLLFGITATDPVTFAGAAVMLGMIALLACVLPLRRAVQIDATEALRSE